MDRFREYLFLASTGAQGVTLCVRLLQSMCSLFIFLALISKHSIKDLQRVSSRSHFMRSSLTINVLFLYLSSSNLQAIYKRSSKGLQRVSSRSHFIRPSLTMLQSMCFLFIFLARIFKQSIRGLQRVSSRPLLLQAESNTREMNLESHRRSLK